MKPWYLYVVLCSDSTLYTGITTDIKRRINEHNTGRGAKYTRGRGPVVLLHLRQYKNRSDASKAESAESDTFEFLVDRFNGRSEHGEDSTVSEEFFSIISELSRENIKLLTNIAKALHEKQQLQE